MYFFSAMIITFKVRECFHKEIKNNILKSRFNIFTLMEKKLKSILELESSIYKLQVTSPFASTNTLYSLASAFYHGSFHDEIKKVGISEDLCQKFIFCLTYNTDFFISWKCNNMQIFIIFFVCWGLVWVINLPVHGVEAKNGNRKQL